MKRIYTLIIISLFSISAFAQFGVKNDYGFKLGLTATPTIGWMKLNQGQSEAIGIGFSYGLLGDFNFSHNYAFSTGLLVTSVNGNSTEKLVLNPYIAPNNNNLDDVYDLKYRMQYLEIPLTIKLKSSQVDHVLWYGQFGLSSGIRLSALQDSKGSTGKVENQNISKNAHFYRAGLIIGGGAEIELARNTNLLVGLTFNNGFTYVKTSNDNNIKNSYIALNLGILF